MKNIVMIILMATFATSAVAQGTTAIAYQCPMKCEGDKTYDKPGKCPVCGMALKQVTVKGPSVNRSMHITGAMKNVMMKGELWGNINLDTISDKQHLYGLGPIEYLSGESMVLDGKSYQSTVISPAEMKVKETYKLKAPFFAYQNIREWKEMEIPDSIIRLDQLEQFLDKATFNQSRPFFFRVTGIADSATVHVVYLPKGTKVNSPEDAHLGQTAYTIRNGGIELLGFFSTEHKTIFTHHDSFIHVHLITSDKKKMGHLDKMDLREGTVKLYLPKE